MNLKSYINTYRIEQSKKLLLRNKKAKLIEVAIDVGFQNVNTYIRVFKNLEGITPNKYRTAVPDKLTGNVTTELGTTFLRYAAAEKIDASVPYDPLIHNRNS